MKPIENVGHLKILYNCLSTENKILSINLKSYTINHFNKTE